MTQKIGTILYKGRLVNHQKSDYITYINSNGGDENIVYDKENPILYVGWEQVKSMVNDGWYDKVSILEKTIQPNKIFWEFSFDENKAQHVAGVNMFVNNVPYYYFQNNYRYTNIDPIFFNIRDLEELKQLLPVNYEFFYQYKDKMLYFLSGDKITSIDLELYKFFEIDLTAFIRQMSLSSKSRGVIDQEGETYEAYKESFPNFDYLQRYLIVLLSKE